MPEVAVKTPSRIPGQLAWLWLSALVIMLDQLTKHMVVDRFSLYERLEVFSHFNLTLAYNRGAAFSFLADAGGWQRWFFTAIAVGASIMILVWLTRLSKAEKLQGAALALILGGALGNFYDRLVLGHVVDFLDFYWGDYHFPAFNIADSAITLGAGLILLDMLLGAKKSHD